MIANAEICSMIKRTFNIPFSFLGKERTAKVEKDDSNLYSPYFIQVSPMEKDQVFIEGDVINIEFDTYEQSASGKYYPASPGVSTTNIPTLTTGEFDEFIYTMYLVIKEYEKKR